MSLPKLIYLRGQKLRHFAPQKAWDTGNKSVMERQKNIIEHHLSPPCYYMTQQFGAHPASLMPRKSVEGGASGLGMETRAEKAEMDEKAKWK